ncbi:MAG: glycosyltransferase family 1 protein [Acidobacteriota bacterium]
MASPLPVSLRQLLSRLRPSWVQRAVRRKIGKAQRRRLAIEQQVVTLEPDGEPRGDVLLAFIIDGFLAPNDDAIPRTHTHFWESVQMARSFVDLGYRVDAVHWTNTAFIPTKPYRVATDVRLLLEHWAPHLPADCLKIMHAETAHPSVHNPAQLARLDAIEKRRGVRLAPVKMIEENRCIDTADVAVILGDDFTHDSYAFAGKPIHRVPISAPAVYDPIEREIATCRNHFMWFGSGGLVHKGLDLVLEAFAGMPEMFLTVCGPIDAERDFERAYWRELYDLPNIHTHGWIDVESQDFLDLARRTMGVVFPSCSEGGGGSVYTCMHAGIVPLTGRGASIPIEPAWGVRLETAEHPEITVESIRVAVREFAARPIEELAAMSAAAYAHANQHHTRERFTEAHRALMAELLDS